MARMKDMLICEIELLARMSGYGVEELLAIYFQHEDDCPLIDKINLLARMSGYDVDELLAIYSQYEGDCQDLGEPVNWRSFIGVTMERDW